MLHEVILALAGANSELLKHVDTCIDLKDFIHPSEKVLLRQILNIAKNYKFLKNFIDCNLIAVLGTKECELQAPLGLYIQSFCGGLDEALEPFRLEILLLEQNVLTNPSMNLVTIFSQVDKYSPIFAVLKSLIDLILSKKIHGCQMLQVLHENTLNAVDESKDYLECILKRCYAVFLKQTMSWMINGELEDPFDEYIIQKNIPQRDTVNDSDASMVTVKDKLDIRDESEFKIVIDYVPVFVSYSLVNDILFVGQIVKILNENPSNIDNFNGNLIFGKRQKDFFAQLASLKESTIIDMKKLEELVQEIRKCVVEHLWKVAVEEDNLYEQLQLMKNFYLLGFGQFFKELLVEASVFSLNSSKNQFSQCVFSSLNEVMTEIASTHFQIDEKILSSFTFKMEHPQNKKVPDMTDLIWSSIKLQYTPKWPLNLIFTPVALEHYNKLFLFLLRVKRCHIEIYNVWKNDIKNKSLRLGKAWKLRNELMFLVNNLQFYLQVDVIETEYNNLISESRKIKDFKQIEKLHNMFLLNVLSHSFLLDVPTNNVGSEALGPTTYSKHFYDILLKNIKICEKFCFLASKGGLESREEEINKLDRSFRKYKNIFMCFLAEYQTQPFKQHAAKLLLRLNFNNWVHNTILEVPK